MIPPAQAAADMSLADAVTSQGVRTHMAALQRIADANDGNRAAASPGYAASARYAQRTLQDAG